MSLNIDRREILIVSGASAALAALGGVNPPRNSMLQLKKAAGLGMVQLDGTLEEKFALLRECGFDGVELDSPAGWNIAELLAARKKTGIEISGVVDSAHWSKPLSDPSEKVRAEGRAALEQAIHDCAAFGGTSVLLVPAVVNQDVSYDAAWERSIAEVKRVLPLAESAKVQIAIENVWNNFLLSPLEAARYVDEFDSPWVGWHFDVGNVINYGWPEQWIRILGKRILKLHVKEYSRKQRDELGLWKGFQVELGEGDNRWPQVMQALREIGYEGWATAEVSGGGKQRLSDVAQRMDRILAS
jgi:hexulose-6-phosphate isomerase